MSNRIRSRGFRCGVALAAGFASLALPVAAHAAEVDLGTSYDYSVLGGQSVTNTGPSVLPGNLGVYPGTSLTGFGVGAGTVGGATHAGDAQALQAQSDLTVAYGVAAGEPSSSNKTGVDLAGQTLTPGTYTWNASAVQTGTVTLNAQNDPAARFVFQIGADFTTLSNFNVVLTGGTSPCNVYWQVGNDAVIGTNNQFVGTILANNDISILNGTTVLGRALARQPGAVTLDTNVFTTPTCTRGAPTTQGSPPVAGTPPGAGTPAPVAAFPGAGTTGNTGTVVNRPAPGSRSTLRTHKGTAALRLTPRARPGSTPNPPRTGAGSCTTGFSARVRGRLVKSVVFSLDGKRIASDRRSPFQVFVKAAAGKHRIKARVSFKDATHAKTRSVAYRGCAAAVLQPRRGPSKFTG